MVNCFPRYLKALNRLSVLVSEGEKDNLLGILKLASGSGLNEAKSIYDLLEAWKLTEKVQVMSFDTTSVNTGRLNGACVLLKNIIGRELLRLA